MDRITQSLLKEFIEEFEITPQGIQKDFEYYVGYCLVSSYLENTFDVETIIVGNGNDTSIDGIAIIVNGHIVENQEQVEAIIAQGFKLEVDLIFFQAKSGEHFETKEIGSFGNGVIDFFATKPKLPRNEEIARCSSIMDFIINNATHLKKNPECGLFFVAAGNPRESDPNYQAILKSTLELLESTNLFSNVTFSLLGAKKINALYQKSKNPIRAEFDFRTSVVIQPLPGIQQVHFGTLQLEEFKKIILDENGNIKSIFEDNVRDSQGEDNQVNQSISSTLNSDNPELFTV
jgi:hypothetical protein